MSGKTTRDWDLSELRAMWSRRREAMESVLRRTDRRGMTRPRRDPVEAEWLRQRGELGPTVDVDVPQDERRLPFERD